MEPVPNNIKADKDPVLDEENPFEAMMERFVRAAELLELEVDVLVPAALENVITQRNAPRIKAYFWSEELVIKRLREVMIRSFHHALDYALQHDVNFRTAAYMLAIDRVAAVRRMRGIYD